ncbi:MAG: hypothetical protein R2780_01130 [Crocinitomicaceae bacterium]
MKITVFLISIFLVVTNNLAQEIKVDPTQTSGVFINNSYWMHGSHAKSFMKAVQSETNFSVGSRYFHHLRSVQIPGLSEKVHLKIQEGIYGQRTSGSCSETYFNSFTSEHYKRSRVARMQVGEEFGLLIHIKMGKNKSLLSFEEQKAFVKFVESKI